MIKGIVQNKWKENLILNWNKGKSYEAKEVAYTYRDILVNIVLSWIRD